MKLRILLILALTLTASSSFAQFDEAGFKQALKVKKGAYLADGSFSGGDRSSSDFRVSNIRVAANPEGYDRLVIDFTGNEGGQKSTLARPPFFMVESESGSKRVNITVYGRAKLDFSSQSAIQSAKKTKHISKIDFIPVVNEDRWIFSIQTQTPVKAEVFELSDPARIIIDLKP